MCRTLVLGDVHGEFKQLKKVLELAKVTEEDLVISLGDIVDRGPDPFKCMQLLDDLPHVIFIQGNHDASFQNWIRTGEDYLGGHHGAAITQNLYNEAPANMKEFVKRFLHNQVPFYVDRNNFAYVHGGFDYRHKLSDQPATALMWDRELWNWALLLKQKDPSLSLPTVEVFKKIFIGHTPTLIWDSAKPMYAAGVWNIDTGGGKGGKITIMDVKSEEYWQA